MSNDRERIKEPWSTPAKAWWIQSPRRTHPFAFLASHLHSLNIEQPRYDQELYEDGGRRLGSAKPDMGNNGKVDM